MRVNSMNAQNVDRKYSEDEVLAEASARCGIIVGPDGCIVHSFDQTEEEAYALFNRTYNEVLASLDNQRLSRRLA